MTTLLKCLIISTSLLGIAYAADTPSKYAQTCGVCHDTGNLNAPKKGDKATWNKLKSQKGINGLVASVKQGMPQMPAKGLCNDCTDDDFAKLIEFMSK